MSATDELRRMLDERGVEYDTRDGNAIKNTYWNDGNGRRFGYTEDVSESGVTTPTLFLVSGQLTFTPEQAIAATLGRGTCRNDSLKQGVGSECGVYLDMADMSWDGQDGSGGFYEPRWCPNCGKAVKR